MGGMQRKNGLREEKAREQRKSKEQNIIMGLIIALILVLLLLLGIVAAVFYWAYTETAEQRALAAAGEVQGEAGSFPETRNGGVVEKDGFRLEPDGEGGYLFCNEREGYSLAIPESITVEISLDDLCCSFGNGNLGLEIYIEHFESEEEAESYIYYSDTFLENGKDHTPERKEMIQVGNYKTYLTQWSRPTLEAIGEDKPNYLCLDLLPGGNRVCTLLFKSAWPMEEEILGIAETIGFVEGENAVTESAIIGFAGTNLKESGWGERGLRDVWSEETKAVYLKYFSQDSPLTWGIFEPSAPVDFETLDEMEEELDFTFDFLLCYKHFHQEGLPDGYVEALENAKKENRFVELTLQTKAQDEGNMVYDILNGEFDRYIRDFAAVIRDTAHPVLFRLCNEMNGDWCDYSAFHTSRDTEIFRELYRYVYGLFEEAGALPYTIWVWNPNERSFPEYDWNHAFRYYPGDEYVDIIGITGYNTGTYYEGESWRSFREIYEPVYREAVLNFEKPIMITEFASSSVGGDKAAWIEDMLEQISDFDQIKAAIWWNGRDLDAEGNVARPYWLDETEETLRAFKENVKR